MKGDPDIFGLQRGDTVCFGEVMSIVLDKADADDKQGGTANWPRNELKTGLRTERVMRLRRVITSVHTGRGRGRAQRIVQCVV